jgi:hypothetical protein
MRNVIDVWLSDSVGVTLEGLSALRMRWTRAARWVGSTVIHLQEMPVRRTSWA